MAIGQYPQFRSLLSQLQNTEITELLEAEQNAAQYDLMFVKDEIETRRLQGRALFIEEFIDAINKASQPRK